MIYLKKLKPIKHILFDYDGVIVDSEKIYYQTWCSILNEQGQKICKNFHRGHYESEVFQKVKPYLINDWSLEQVSNYRRKMFNEMVVNKQLELVPGIEVLLETLQLEAPLSIVSNSEHEEVNIGLEANGIKSFFKNFFCFIETIKRKPMPDLYLLALDRLKLKGNEVIAIEDSISGIKSAISAQIPVICINGLKQEKSYCKLRRIPFCKTPIGLVRKIKMNKNWEI